MIDDEAQAIVDQCKNYTARGEPNKSEAVGPIVVIVLVIFVLVSGVAIYYIIHMWQTTRRIMVVPIILTLVGFYLQLIFVWLYPFTKNLNEDVNSGVPACILFMSGLVNATSYIFALVVTIKYWKADRLDAKTSSMIAQIFPYIG